MNIIISSTSQVPIYQQIVEQIREAIIKGELLEGTIMPSIRTLARDLKISVITTKRVYEELENEGLIITRTGKGTYVAPSNIELMRETRLKEIEQHLDTAIALGKSIDLSLEDMMKMLGIIYEEVEE